MVKGERETSGISRIHDNIRELVENCGYEYVGSELLVEDRRSVLEVFIDSLGGINVKDCETVSRRLGKMLDEGNPGLPERYFLQVSSPGVERPLLRFGDYERFVGKMVRIKLREAVIERKTLTGVIESSIDGKIVLLECEAGSLNILFENILKANLVFELPKSNKPGTKEKNRRRQQ
ncbi:MAG: ribosome maturation factor RimP [Thermovirgaceae bacterium]|nr:ribosome maturation factor RimP [Thermovirgaceae bacterium]